MRTTNSIACRSEIGDLTSKPASLAERIKIRNDCGPSEAKCFSKATPAMTECTQPSFTNHGRRQVVARFDGYVTSDGGAVLLRQTEQRTGTCGSSPTVSAIIASPGRSNTACASWSPSVYGLALGYEDLNDHDQLRSSDRYTLDQQIHVRPFSQGRSHAHHQLGACTIQLSLRSTFSPGTSLCARLRPSNIDASEGSLEEVQRIVAQLRRAWPEKNSFAADVECAA